MPAAAATSTLRLERWAAAASLGSGAVHGLLVRTHLREWWGYGVFFIVASTAQVVLGLALLTDAINPRDMKVHWRTAKSWMYGLGIAGNLALIALYTVTRTTGIPAFGPGAGEVEAVSFVDLVSKALEVIAVAILLVLFRRQQAENRAAAAVVLS
jgi:hypothetical protein